MKPSLIITAIVVLVTTATSVAQHVRFDLGDGAHVATGAVSLTPEDLYSESAGFGWTVRPTGSFVRDRLTAARSEFLIDGVSGDSIKFRYDVEPGTWWVTLWAEAGMEDSTTLSISINGQIQALDWHAFNPPAEPRTDIQAIYRLFHGVATATDGMISVEMRGGHDLVRLLGISITADPVPAAKDAAFVERIASVGKYGPHLRMERIMKGEDPELTSLAKDLRDASEADPDDAFAAYWLEQIDILRDAEENIRLMGWEWATDSTGLGIFDRFHQAVMQFDGLLARPEVGSYPLFERVLFQRGRLHHWLYLERGGPSTRLQAVVDLLAMRGRYPDDELLAMYNGKRIHMPGPCDDLETGEGAPEWSVLELEAICRLRSEIHWWVNDRQSATGEFGGKIGDDVELFRWWPPIVLAGDTTAFRGWRRLADGVMVARKVYKGYSRRAIDVEHASEFIADTAPEMVFYSDNPEYVDRLRYSSDYFNNLWTAYTPSGRRYFRSAWFSSTEVDDRPPRNRDLEMNTRAVKAVRYLAWKTGDPAVVDPLHEWSSAWRHAAMRTEKGKPAGIIPASIRFPDEALNGDEPTWYIANMFWDYFDWEHRGTQMLDQLLFAYTLTGDESLLDPMLASLDLIRDFEAKGWPSVNRAEAGSAEWAAGALKARPQFWNSVEQWRFHTGDTANDGLLVKYGTPYARFRITRDQDYLVAGLNALLDEVRYNTPLRTSEVLHTDRVRTPAAMHLKAMLTGDGTAEGSSPYYAASWEGTTEGFTALVKDAGFDLLDIDVFVHGVVQGVDDEQHVTLRVWKLEPGGYILTVADQTGVLANEPIEITERGQRIQIPCSPNQLTSIRIESL